MKKTFLSILFVLVFLFPAYQNANLAAHEGMWLPHLLRQQKLAEMQELGLKLQDYDIYNPNGSAIIDAVIQFGRGCSGSVISSQGLVLTNHHCGYSQIQNHSTIQNNLLEDGFWAMSKTEELPNPGLTITFIERIDDVTDYVKQRLEQDRELDTDGVLYLSPTYLNRIAREKVGEQFLVDHPGMDMEIRPFFEGNQYFMFTRRIYSDIRLVGAPPSSIGKFGADTDNWTWPRHTGDFALFRIYTDKNGHPATYSPDNIPMQPKRWLPISTKGVSENDFAMIMGFPGTTNKYYTSWEVAERRDIDNAVRIKMRRVRQNAMLEMMLVDPAVKIQYASKYSGSTNAYKNAIGTNWAINLRDFEELKRHDQNRLLSWASENNLPQYQAALNEIEQIVTGRASLRYRSWALNEGITRGVEFAAIPVATADVLLRALEEQNDEQIDTQSRQLMTDFLTFANKDYNPEVDRKVAKAMIAEYIKHIAREDLPDYFNTIFTQFGGNVDDFVDHIFDTSIFSSENSLEAFLSAPNAEKLRADPMLLFAKLVRNEAASLATQLSTFDNPFAIARRAYLEGILAMDGMLKHFPDANLTLRLSYGQVQGYQPSDAVTYAHQTTMTGIMEKEDPDNWEFVVPAKLKELYQNRDFGDYAMADGRMPVNFVASTHTTGGNSGSPVMNGNGELIGINFDRNWHGVGGDIQFLPDYQRSIIVDARYMLFIIDKFAGARHLIEELELR